MTAVEARAAAADARLRTHHVVVLELLLRRIPGGPGSLRCLHQHESSHEQTNDHQDHDDVEQENLQVLRVIGVRRILADLAEVSAEALAALTLTVEADAAVHALARTVLDLARHDLNVATHVLLAAKLRGELELHDAAITGDVPR